MKITGLRAEKTIAPSELASEWVLNLRVNTVFGDNDGNSLYFRVMQETSTDPIAISLATGYIFAAQEFTGPASNYRVIKASVVVEEDK